MVHGDPVTYANHRELHRCTACRGHPELGGLGQVAQVDMSGYDFVKGIDYADQWFFQIVTGVAHSVKQSPVRRPGDSLSHLLTLKTTFIH